MRATPIRVVVVDDHGMFRSGLIELLQSVPDVDVVGDGGTGADAVTLTERLKPDVLVLDVEMPGPGPTAAIREVHEANRGTKIVILTMHDNAELLRSLLEAGVAGYLLKNAGRAELTAAICSAYRNDGSVLLSVSRSTVTEIVRAEPRSELLSARELDVLILLAQGRSNREIAKLLYISDGTAKRHCANIYAKLGCNARSDAVRKATELGIINNAVMRKATRKPSTVGDAEAVDDHLLAGDRVLEDDRRGA